jgi:thiol-disulfide isomerase/thioredoxin
MNKILAIFLVLIFTSGLLLVGCSTKPSETQPSEAAEVGKTAPNFQLENLEAKTVSLDSLRGKPVLINFWATWCGPCLDEMPFLQEIYSEWSSKGLMFLSINSGETATKVRSYMQQFGFSFPALVDSKNEVAATYRILYLPTTILVDKNGVILEIKVGAFPDKATIEKELLSKVFPDI